VTFLEWGSAEATQRTLARRLATLVTDPHLSPALPRLRAATGRALARLGDPRDGVSVHGHIPDLAWCSVPTGPFWLGARAADQEAYDNEKPRHRLTLPAFFIARYPITNAQFSPFIVDGGYENKQWWTEAGWAWRHGNEPEPDLTWIADQDLRKQYAEWLAQRPVARRSTPFFWDDERYNLANQPVIGVSWYEAIAYCAWLHQQCIMCGQGVTMESEPLATLLSTGGWQVRLPTEAEWEKAVGGDADRRQQRRYAWGDTWDVTRANVDNQVEYPCAVGIFLAGAAACGALDMTGNVWEWTLSQYAEYPYKSDARNAPAGEASRVLRGGAWGDHARDARVSSRSLAPPAFFSSYVGLRVVVAPVL
jgi:formylglycine-generating enzyme required for sulfatase activity